MNKSGELILTSGGFPVIDLRANYGDRFKVMRDGCGDQMIPHKYGHFYVHSSTELACYIGCPTRRGLNAKLKKVQASLPVRVRQRGDWEVVFTFEPDLFPGLAKMLKARRRRQYSAEQLAQMRERATRMREALTK